MKFTAREPQEIITAAILDHHRINVWAGMGMGKTGASLDALDKLAVVEDGPTLVVGPLRVAEVTWPDEVAKWDHIASRWACSAIVGTKEARLKALKADANLFTVNFENVPWLCDHLTAGKGRWPFKRVIFDESTRLRGFRLKQGTAQAKSLGKLAHTQIERWVNLTGTPAPNGLIGLWGQNWFVDEGRALGRTFTAFQDRWFQRGREKIELSGGGHFDRPVTRPVEWADEEITERLKSCTISLATKDWFPDLREPIVNVIKVRLPTKARLHYRQMEKDYFTQVRSAEIEAVHAASKSIKLLQIASGAVYDADHIWHHLHDEKLYAVQSVLEEAAGAPVLVVYWWKPTLERLAKAFKKGCVVKTAETIRAWNRGQIPIGFVHSASLGHGVSLQDGSNVICHVDQWWDLEKHDQINERLGALRQMQSGYDRDVFQHYIVAEGTLDEDVVERRKTKSSVQDALMRAMRKRG